MIKPTIGRIVWVWRAEVQNYLPADDKQPELGRICFVHDNRTVNIAGDTHGGERFTITRVTLLQDDDAPPLPEYSYCTWMPYQNGQAVKTEAAESLLNEQSKS